MFHIKFYHYDNIMELSEQCQQIINKQYSKKEYYSQYYTNHRKEILEKQKYYREAIKVKNKTKQQNLLEFQQHFKHLIK